MNKEFEALQARIDALENRLAALDRAGATDETILPAPVRIVDDAGTTIAEITREKNDSAIRLYNTEQQAVATLGADGTLSGYLAVRNRNGTLVGYLDVERFGARLQLHSNNEDGGGVALFGADADETGGGINIIAAGNGGGISLWAQQGSGEIRIDDAEGNERVIDTDR